jgi:hypothetical protein
VRCHLCGATWGGGRVLPVELPEELRSWKALSNGWPIEGVAHQRLRAEVLSELQRRGSPVASLLPGDRFQPSYLDIPSEPEADFLWSSIGSVVVSDRARAALASAGVRGVTFSPVSRRKVGRSRATVPAPTPISGEPEELLLDLPEAGSEDGRRPLYEMVVTAESGLPPGVSADALCSACGRLPYDRDSRQLVMQPSMWQGDDIFLLATTLWIVVSDRVRNLLVNLGATNV